MLVRGIGIGDVSIKKVLSVLVNSSHKIKPQKNYYDKLEVDEFWTYAGNKKNKIWLLYAYHRDTGEIVDYVWGKRNYRTAKKLRDSLRSKGIGYDMVCTDNWDSFISVFKEYNHITGKKYTKGIEGNNCRLRHRSRRAFRKTCCFSKKFFNHFKVFDLAFFLYQLRVCINLCSIFYNTTKFIISPTPLVKLYTQYRLTFY
jgi:IS1 family transposase